MAQRKRRTKTGKIIVAPHTEPRRHLPSMRGWSRRRSSQSVREMGWWVAEVCLPTGPHYLIHDENNTIRVTVPAIDTVTRRLSRTHKETARMVMELTITWEVMVDRMAARGRDVERVRLSRNGNFITSDELWRWQDAPELYEELMELPEGARRQKVREHHVSRITKKV